MPIVNRAVLKGYLERGDKPTQTQFATLIDSMVNIVEDRYLIGLREYDPLKQYLLGDTMIYNNALYECLSSTTGVFDPVKWKVIVSLGSVVYTGTWDASANSPILADGTGVKGYYYVVTVPGNRNLGSGAIDFEISDWVIYNGSIWQKVDNSQAPVVASDVAFTPTGTISSTNVQNAIVEVHNESDISLLLKADKVVGATVDDIAVLDANGNLIDGGKQLSDYLDKNNSISYSPSGDYNPATKKYVDDVDASKADKVSGAVNNDIAILDSTGNLVDGGKQLSDYLDKNNSISFTPTGDYNPATKKYVDDVDATKADKVTSAVNDDIAILNASGNLVDGGKKLSDYLDKNNATSYSPTGNFNPATKKYVDDADASKADKVAGAITDDIAILSATGNLVDGGKKLSDYLDKNNSSSYTPSGNFNPATKKYVDDIGASKADKVSGAVTDDIAILSATGNLVDGGKKLSDYLDKNNSSSYSPTGNFNPATKKYVDDADVLKADKVTSAIANDIAILNASGNLVDGGMKLTDYLDKNNITSYTPTGNYNPATKKYVDDSIAGVPGQVKVVVLPFTFDTAYGTASNTFGRVPLQVTVPAVADVFPGATTINAKMYVDFLTQNSASPNTTGEVALSEWTFAMNATVPTAVAGSTTSLPYTNSAWTKIVSSSFALTASKSYQVILRKVLGNGASQAQIEGAALVLFYS